MYPRERLRRAMALYAVTDRTWLAGRTLPGCVAEVLAGGATFVQLREKDAPHEETVALARAILPLEAQADGVHVGQDDAACADARDLLGPDKIVGVSVQTVGQALAAQAAGADYLGVGALFGTPTKPDATLVSLDELRAVCQAVDVPVVAIGGLNERTVPALAGTGVDGAAVVSALFAAADPQAAARTLAARVRAVLE